MPVARRGRHLAQATDKPAYPHGLKPQRLAAGYVSVSYRVYVPFAFLGSLLWASAVYSIGILIYFGGPALGDTLSNLVGHIFLIAAAIVLLALITLNVWHSNHHRRRFTLEALSFVPALENDARGMAREVKHEAQAIERHIEHGAQGVAKHIPHPDGQRNNTST